MTSNAGALPPFGMSNDDDNQSKPPAKKPSLSQSVQASDTTPSGEEPIKWVVVRKTMGRLQAEMFANLLKSFDIPARAWAESAGEAFGLTVGLLGTGFVGVPEEFAKEAEAILTEAENAPLVWEDDDFEEFDPDAI